MTYQAGRRLTPAGGSIQPPPAHAGGPPRPSATGIKRVLFLLLGSQFVALGIAGAFLPLLPATPFFLLAAYFFARSSPRLHGWLLAWPVAGPLIRDWQRHRGVRLKVKVVALVLLPLVIASSIYFGRLTPYPSVILMVLGAIGASVVIGLPRVRTASAPTTATVTTTPSD